MSQTKNTPQPLDDDALSETAGGFIFVTGPQWEAQATNPQKQLQKMRCLVCAKTVYVPLGTKNCTCGNPLQQVDDDERDAAFLM